MEFHAPLQSVLQNFNFARAKSGQGSINNVQHIIVPAAPYQQPEAFQETRFL
jgi:hypothetical protein